MVVEDACRRYLTHCRDERRLSTNTLAAYGQDLREFGARFGGWAVVAVSGEELVGHVSYLREERGLAPATVKRRIACLKGLFGWLCRRGLLATNPFGHIDVRVRIPDRLPRCLAPSEARRLMAAADRSATRTRLLVRLLLATGARVGELASLRIGDVDLCDGTVRIVGKGDRERRVFLANERLVEDLGLYLRTERSEARREDALLVGGLGRRSSPASLRSQVKVLGCVAGLERRVTPHMLRHTAATTLVESGVDIRFVQKLLGHRSISTTQMYTHVSDRALKEAITRADICAKFAA